MAANEKSVKKAAEKLFITQQSLSEHIKKLEDELGVMLINRTRPLSLTEAGLRLERGAGEILKARDQTLNDINIIRGKDSENVLTIGINQVGVPPFLPELILRFNQACPGCVVNVTDFDGLACENDYIDLFFPIPPLDDSLQHVILNPDHVSVMIDAELFRRTYGDNTECVSDQLRKSGDINFLRNMPFIVNNNPSHELSGLIYMQNPNFEPVIGLKADRLELMISMCIKGVGALITAEGAAKRMLISFFGQIPGSILFFKLKNQAANYSLAISYKKNKQLSRAELDFINQAKLFFDSE